jgi:hypothetical protein
MEARDRFAEDMHACHTDVANVHVGFLRNERVGSTVFTPTFTTPGNDVPTYNCFTACFVAIYQFFRNFFASWMMTDLNYRHCELAFDQSMFRRDQLRPIGGFHYTPGCYVAYATNLNDMVLKRKPRTYEPKRDASSLKQSGIINPDRAYEWIHLSLPRYQVEKMIKLCEGERGKPYDVRALERMPIFPKKLKHARRWHEQHWHCTNFTSFMLQQAGVLVGLDPNALTADDVYLYLKGNRFEQEWQTTPSKRIKEYQAR